MTAGALPPLLTVDETARLLKVSPDLVRRRCTAGDLPAYRVRGQWRIRTARLLAGLPTEAAA